MPLGGLKAYEGKTSAAVVLLEELKTTVDQDTLCVAEDTVTTQLEPFTAVELRMTAQT